MRRPIGGTAAADVAPIARLCLENDLCQKKSSKPATMGTQFYKSSDCPVCPICAAQDKPTSGFLSLLGAPARRALAQAGISTLAELSQHSEAEILKLHGVGPKTLPVLRQALDDAGLAFASPTQ